MGEFYEQEDERSPKIPYSHLAREICPEQERVQKLVPFLGAGSSLARRWNPASAAAGEPEPVGVAEAIRSLEFDGSAKLLMELAIRVAARVQTLEKKQAGRPARNALAEAKASLYPPSANQLSAALADLSEYDAFERPRRTLATWMKSADDRSLTKLARWLAELTDVGPSVPSLLSVASYYEYAHKRSPMWSVLKEIFANKDRPTSVHFLVARAAKHHLSRKPKKDYLIITTNYDRLTEVALDCAGVPYCVLAVTLKDQQVDVRFSKGMQSYLEMNDEDFAEMKQDHLRKYPKNFTLELDKRVAIVYKIHGCLYPEQKDRDSVVLSDEDYIQYLMQMHDGNGMVPSEITALTETPGFLFLGYSFSDWNVRGLYKALLRARPKERQAGIQDYAVIRDFSAYDSKFCQESQSKIHLVVTDLGRFSRTVRQKLKNHA